MYAPRAVTLSTGEVLPASTVVWCAGMRANPLTACPACRKPIHRLISSFEVSTAQSTKSMLSDKNLKAKGFTKLVNEGGGKFRNVT